MLLSEMHLPMPRERPMNRDDLKKAVLIHLRIQGEQRIGAERMMDEVLVPFPPKYVFDGKSVLWLEREVRRRLKI